MSCSLMKAHMTRVISSPSSSTIGFLTSIFAIGDPYPGGGDAIGARRLRLREDVSRPWDGKLTATSSPGRPRAKEEPDATLRNPATQRLDDRRRTSAGSEALDGGRRQGVSERHPLDSQLRDLRGGRRTW